MTNESNEIKTDLPITQNNHKVDIVKNQYIHKEVHLEKSPVLPTFLQKVKEYIGLIMAILGALSTLFTAVILFCIWSYLRDLGSQDLFLESVASANTLALVLITAFILALITLGIVFPSLYVFCLTTVSYKDNKPPIMLLVPFIGAPLLFLITVIIMLIHFGDSYWSFIVVFGSPLFFTGIILFTKFKKQQRTIFNQIYQSLEPTRRTENKEIADKQLEGKKKADMFGVCFFLVILCWISMFPLIILNDLWIDKIDSFYSSLPFILCIMLGYLPGTAYLLLCHYKASIQKVIITIFLTVIGVVTIEMFIFPIKVKTTVFKSAGIYQEHEQYFLLLNTELKETIVKKFFDDDSKLKLAKDQNQQLEEFQQKNIFKAYTLYYLGNVRLLCKNSFDPDKLKQQNKNQLLGSCFTFTPEEVRRIYKLLPDNNH